MMTLLQANEVVEKTSGMIEAVSDGKIDTLLKQLISMGVELGKSILLAIAIYIAGKFIIKLINKVVRQMLERRGVDATIQSFLKSFVSILLNILLIITVISALGVNTTSFAALLASVGVAAGMALSGNLQNLAGGLIILLFKPFKVGDFIEAQGTMGTVKEIQIIHTILQTVDNKEIFLPNGSLSSGSITNYNKMGTRRVDFTVSVEYGTDVEKVLNVLKSIAVSDERILKDPAPFYALSALADSSVNFTFRVWVNSTDYWGVYFDVNKRIYEDFNRIGISFPFPQLQIHQK
ncbi:MAG: mechanosensitive ion channel [Bacteroidaceae bacterium]|nr:mechanosensitive ion channel [Bacteroidaceae bacterium]